MKVKPKSWFMRNLLLCITLLSFSAFLFGCSGSDGSPGAAGAPGTDATSYGTITGTIKDLYGNTVGALTPTVSPAVDGATITASDATTGVYSAVLPNGAYTLTFKKDGYTTQTQTVNAVATKTKTLDIYMQPTGAFAVNAGADKTVTISSTATTDYTLPAGTVTYFDPSISAASQTIAWSVVDGAATIKSGGTTTAPTITLNKTSDYKAVLVQNNPDNYADATGKKIPLNRWRVVPLTVQATRAAAQGTVKAVTLRMTVTNGAVVKKDDMVVSVALPVVPSTGLRNIPVGQPVLLQGPAQATYAWTMTKPTGSTATLNDAASRYPDFIPDVSGTYTISEAGTARITVMAGNYVGMMAAYQAPDAGCASSGACHTTFNNTTRMNTWMTTGHKDVMFEGMRELPPGGHYSATCAPCHTTGAKYYTTTVSSNSFADLSTSETDASGKTLFTWFNDNHKQGNPNIESEIATRFPKTYKLTGIQCEVCHGPNLGPAHGSFKATDPPYSETSRISFSSNSCGFCHGRPTSHGALQQWASSSHGNYTEFATDGHVIGGSCAGCHSAQGFFILKAQLADGKGNRTITVPASLTKDTAEPVSCIVCHDPHNEGDLMVSEEVPTRIEGNTPFLPSGFMANGVGRGAQCIFCHNSRNGYDATQGYASLHEDGDAKWGTLTSYAEPHVARQGDVLMGRNAYFFGSGYVGERSKHSFIADTCVECHMVLSDPPSTLGSSSRPDHTFGNTVSQSCEACHGDYNGGTLSEYFEYQISVLQSEIQKAITRLKGDGVAVIFYPGRTPKVSTDGGTTQVNLSAYIAFNNTLAKVLWNMALVEDGSEGAHNPTFTWKVLDVSIKAAKAL